VVKLGLASWEEVPTFFFFPQPMGLGAPTFAGGIGARGRNLHGVEAIELGQAELRRFC